MPTITKPTTTTLFWDSNNNAPAQTPSVRNWQIESNGVLASMAAPDGFEVSIAPLSTNAVPRIPGARAGVVYYEIQVTVSYPDSFNETQWSSVDVSVTLGDPDLFGNPFQCGISVVRPLAHAAPSYVLDEHKVTWPYLRGDGNHAALEKITVNWGDGQIEDFSVSNTPIPLQSGTTGAIYLPPWSAQTTAPVSHTFTPDADGNGTGVPITFWITDMAGQRSTKKGIVVEPQIKLRVLDDAQKSDNFLFDFLESYGRTGKIGQPLLTSGSANTLGPTTRDLMTDPTGRLFRAVCAMAANYSFSFSLSDLPVTGADSNLGLIATPIQRVTVPLVIEHPPEDALSLVSGSLLTAKESNSALAFSRYKRSFPASRPANLQPGQTNQQWPFSLTQITPTRAILTNVTAPRLAVAGALIYLAGRHKSAETRLYRSDDEASSWEEIGMIWSAEYFHADFEMLIGGGGCSVALKRVEVATNQYRLELWFRKTFDLANWQAEPVKIAENNGPLSLDVTLSVYPQILNLALIGGSNSLLVRSNLYFGFRHSADQGATWREVAG